MKFWTKIQIKWYVFIAEIRYKIARIQKCIDVAKVVYKNYQHNELVSLVRAYRYESPAAQNMLMFHGWLMDATTTEITYHNKVITVTFDNRDWKDID